MKAFLKQIARRFGYDILHLPTDPLVRRQMDLLRSSRIDLILDVGANTGQFAKRMRQWGGIKGRLFLLNLCPTHINN